MSKHGLKYLVDSLLFIDICAIALIGFIMGFVIPGGHGMGAERSFLWLNRHGWGDIHLFLSLVLLALLALHLFLNWTWIASSSKTFFGQRWKTVVLSFFGASFGLILVGWLIKMI